MLRLASGMPTNSSLLLALSSGIALALLQVLPPPLVFGRLLTCPLSRAADESLVIRPLRMPAHSHSQDTVSTVTWV